MRRPDRHAATEDDGFTLIEVVVALFLLGLVAAAALTFFVRGVQNTTHLQRSQTAVGVANRAMEQVRAVSPRVVDPVTVTSGLLIGRSKASVEAAWASASVLDTAESNAVWDTAAASRPSVALPVTSTTTVSGQPFTVTTLIGTCYRATTASASNQACTKAQPAGTVELFRVTVVVSWQPGKLGECGAAGCSYRLSTLVDPTKDASWNLSAKPVAYDDDSQWVAGDPADVQHVRANDVIGFVPAGVNPTTITAAPAIGTAAAVTTGTEIGQIRFTPPTSQSGTTTMRYRLRDGAGRTSNEATVTLKVFPRANTGSITVLAGSVTTFAAPALGTGLTASIATQPAAGRGSAAGSGGDLVYTAPSSATSATFEYVVTDSSGLASAKAMISVTVQAATPPAVSDVTPHLPVSKVTTSRDLGILDLNGLTPPTGFVVTPKSAPVRVSAAGASAGTVSQSPAKSELFYTQDSTGELNAPGVYEFTYTITKTGGTESAVKKSTVFIDPLAVDFSAGTYQGSTPVNINPPAGNAPVTYANLQYVLTSPVSCSLGGGANVSRAAVVTVTASSGVFRFTAPGWSNGNSSGTCSFDYQTRWTSGAYTLTSEVATGTLGVKR